MYNHASMLEGSAKDVPDKIAVVFNDVRMTYAQLNGMANQVANALTEMGIKKGDKIALSGRARVTCVENAKPDLLLQADLFGPSAY